MKRPAAIVLCLALFCTGCRPDVVVEIASRIYPDGSIHRQVDLSAGEKPGGPPPEAPGWLAEHTGLVLAAADDWDRVEHSPSGFHAEGIFQTAADLPVVLAHLEGGLRIPDRQEVRIDQDDLIIMTRWRYLERFGDPYGPAQFDAALQKLAEVLGSYYKEELTAMYGSRIDPEGVDRFLMQQAIPMVRDFLGADRIEADARSTHEHYSRLREIVESYGGPVIYPETLGPGEEPPDFWDLQFDPLMAWSRERIAEAVSTPEEVVSPHHLQFIPDSSNLEERLEEFMSRSYDSEEAAQDELEPALQAMKGLYASGSSPRYRFRCRVSLPGTVLNTNGVTDGEELVWFFRGEELPAGDRSLMAESVELNRSALRALSARRSFTQLEALNLVDILDKQDPDDRLKNLLQKAVEEGRLSLLGDKENGLPEDGQALALELLAILQAN